MKKLVFFISFILCMPAYAAMKNPGQIQKAIDEAVNKYQLTGVNITVKNTAHNQSSHYSSGVADKELNTPLQITHLMQIGSTTKSFIASLILMLEADSEKGKIKFHFNIEQSLGEWFPEYKDWKDIKIKQLLNMTSGIYNYTANDQLFNELARNPQHNWSPQELINLAYTHKPNTRFQAGESYEYSNTNYILLGLLIEKLTNKPLEAVMQERIFNRYPQKFQHTFYDPQYYPANHINEMARGYMLDPMRHPQFYPKDITSVTLSWAGAAGGILGTTNDLANWAELLFSNKFLPEKQLKELETLVCAEKECGYGKPLPNNSGFNGYGLGVGHAYDEKYGEVWTHTGGTLGYHSIFIYLPQLSLSMAIVINQIGPEIDGGDDVMHIANIVLEKMLNKNITTSN